MLNSVETQYQQSKDTGINYSMEYKIDNPCQNKKNNINSYPINRDIDYSSFNSYDLHITKKSSIKRTVYDLRKLS